MPISNYVWISGAGIIVSGGVMLWNIARTLFTSEFDFVDVERELRGGKDYQYPPLPALGAKPGAMVAGNFEAEKSKGLLGEGQLDEEFRAAEELLDDEEADKGFAEEAVEFVEVSELADLGEEDDEMDSLVQNADGMSSSGKLRDPFEKNADTGREDNSGPRQRRKRKETAEVSAASGDPPRPPAKTDS